MSASIHQPPPHSKRAFCRSLPLCVDLDGTLVQSDLLLESLLLLVKRKPYCLLLIPFWLWHGRAVLKARVAAEVELRFEALPYNQELVRWLELERATGRALWLCTGADRRLAAGVASHLKIFDGLVSGDGSVNLAGPNKAKQLVERFGESCFDYCGNERRDLAIWKRAHGAIVVHNSDRFVRKVRRHAAVLRTFGRPSNGPRAVINAMRPHQWAKNALLFVPLLAAHRGSSISSLLLTAMAAVAFCLCASSAYVLNDLLDLESDRSHTRKAKRPFASGQLSILTGLVLIPVLIGAALLVSLLLPRQFMFTLSLYYLLTISYSVALKSIVLIDVLTLSALYTMRIFAGAAVTSIELSFWLLLFSTFLFLSLALVKRYAELRALDNERRKQAVGRDYYVVDLPILQNLGTAAGYLSVLTLSLYINSPEVDVLYRRPMLMWVPCALLLYWVSRVWVKAQRDEMDDDPVVFAFRDPMSRVIATLVAISVFLAI